MNIADILNQGNVAEIVPDDKRQSLGVKLLEGYRNDVASRADWEQRLATVLDMAMQVSKEKTFPWPGAANTTFPLITLASLNFQSRAFPQLLNKPDLVRVQVLKYADADVKDPATGKIIPMKDAVRMQRELAQRVSKSMSFQLLQQSDWEDNFDTLLMVLGLVGSCFKKVWFDPVTSRNAETLVLPQDLVVAYTTRKIKDAIRVTHRFYLSANEIESRVRQGIYLAMDTPPPPSTNFNVVQARTDEAVGVYPGRIEDMDVLMLEMHTWVDLDGDGYAEPYIVTMEEASGRVRRIVKRFGPHSVEHNGTEVARIVPDEYFAAYKLLPSPDGSLYGLGFGALLGNINSVVTSAVNQMLDAATKANLGGGFLSKEVRMRGGVVPMRQGEFIRTEASAEALSRGIVQLPVNQPSQVLMSLVDYLVTYGERIVGATDVLTGITPGQNTPAETSRNAVEQGLKVYSGIITRVWRSMAKEFRMWFKLNQKYYEPMTYDFVRNGDYSAPLGIMESAIVPGSSTEVVSDSARLAQASALLQVAGGAPPGTFDMYLVYQQYLKALKVNDIEAILPDPQSPLANPPQAPLPVQLAQLKAQGLQEKTQGQLKQTVLKLISDAPLKAAQIKKLEAEAAAVPLEASVHAANTELAYSKAKHEGMMDVLNLLQKELARTEDHGNKSDSSGVGGVEGASGNQGANPVDKPTGDSGS